MSNWNYNGKRLEIRGIFCRIKIKSLFANSEPIWQKSNFAKGKLGIPKLKAIFQLLTSNLRNFQVMGTDIIKAKTQNEKASLKN